MIVASKLPGQYVLAVAGQILELGASVTLNGCHPHATHPSNLYGGFGLTRYVLAEVWTAWRAAHADSDLVRNNLIHAEETEVLIKAWIAKHGGVRSGLEGAGRGF